ncbi:uncharacterized protein LOC144449593 [Glandiceps talaboti]
MANRDDHSVCRNCRQCSSDAPCTVCMSWDPLLWAELGSSVDHGKGKETRRKGRSILSSTSPAGAGHAMSSLSDSTTGKTAPTGQNRPFQGETSTSTSTGVNGGSLTQHLHNQSDRNDSPLIGNRKSDTGSTRSACVGSQGNGTEPAPCLSTSLGSGSNVMRTETFREPLLGNTPSNTTNNAVLPMPGDERVSVRLSPRHRSVLRSRSPSPCRRRRRESHDSTVSSSSHSDYSPRRYKSRRGRSLSRHKKSGRGQRSHKRKHYRSSSSESPSSRSSYYRRSKRYRRRHSSSTSPSGDRRRYRRHYDHERRIDLDRRHAYYDESRHGVERHQRPEPASRSAYHQPASIDTEVIRQAVLEAVAALHPELTRAGAPTSDMSTGGATPLSSQRVSHRERMTDPDAISVAASHSKDFGESSGEEERSRDHSPTISRASSPCREEEPVFAYKDCIQWVYSHFPAECTPPNLVLPPLSETGAALRASNPKDQSTPLSLPYSSLVQPLHDKIYQEVVGSGKDHTALRAGAYPWFRYGGKAYRTHSSQPACSHPPLDGDVDAVDQDPSSFRAVYIDKAHIKKLGDSAHQQLCVTSTLNWFLAVLFKELQAVNLNSPKVSRIIEIVDKGLSHIAESACREYTTLQLMERDAFLKRKSVSLSSELKQEARLAPIATTSLFDGRLTALAARASEAKQRERLLWDKPPTPRVQQPRAKQAGNRPVPVGRGKQPSVPYKSKTFNRGRGRGNVSKPKTDNMPRPFSDSAGRGSGSAQRS